MNRNNGEGLYLNISGLWFWIAVLSVIFLLGSIGLGWLVKSLAVILLLILLAPVIAYLAFRWWFQRNVVEANCPVCNTTFVGLNQRQTQCPSCGEVLMVQNKQFVRYTPPGTVDVDVVDISSQEVE